IDVLAKEKVVLRAGQAEVVLAGGDITFTCPGTFTVKAGQVPFGGGATAGPQLARFASALAELPATFSQRFKLEGFGTGPLGFADPPRLRAYAPDGRLLASTSIDQNGLSGRVYSEQEEALVVLIGTGEWEFDEVVELGV